MTAVSTAVEQGRQRPFLSMLGKCTRFIECSGAVISVLCLALLFSALLANVTLRYTMGSGITWAYEIHALLLPWLVAGGMVIAAARGRNIAIAILPTMLSPAAARVLALIVFSLVLSISISVLWTSKPILIAAKYQSLSTLGIKQIWGYASLIYAFGAMAVISVLDILRVSIEDPALSDAFADSSLS